MELFDYIQGARSGRGAHDLERQAMSDGFLADALDGFARAEGDHLAALGRISARVAGVRPVPDFEARIRAWSVGIAVALVGAAVAGGVWLFAGESTAPPAKPVHMRVIDDVQPMLPPVEVVIEADFSRDELRDFSLRDSLRRDSLPPR